MSAKTNAEVVIDGKVYTLSGYENEEYLQKVAAYINNKIAEFDDMDEYKHLPGNMKSTLIELNIADDYFKAKALVEKLLVLCLKLLHACLSILGLYLIGN